MNQEYKGKEKTELWSQPGGIEMGQGWMKAKYPWGVDAVDTKP